MFCCEKDRTTNYCSECGKQLHLLGSLVKQLRRNRDMAQSRELQYKWARWANAVEELITRQPTPKPQEMPAQYQLLRDFEVFAIKAALVKTNYNRHRTAQMLGIGERTLYRKINQYDLAGYKFRRLKNGPRL